MDRGPKRLFTEAGSAVAVTFVSRSVLERLMLSDPAITRNFFQLLSARILLREAQLHASALKDPGRKIAKQLLALADQIGETIGPKVRLRVCLTHQQMADMLGIRRETATIHLNLLVRAGALEFRRGEAWLDKGRLRAIVEGRHAVQRHRGACDRRSAAS